VIEAETLGAFAPVQAFLASGRAPPAVMSLSEIDGFLAGVAIGPAPITSDEWLPEIWGNQEPAFREPADMRTVLAAIMNRYREIPFCLRRDPPEFVPILERSLTAQMAASAWAKGFFHAVKLRRQAWTPLFKEAQARTLLTPLLIVLPAVKPDSRHDCFPPPAIVAKAVGSIPLAIAGIDDYWQERRELGDSCGSMRQRRTPPNSQVPFGFWRGYRDCRRR
jgi:uncharacterized protein